MSLTLVFRLQAALFAFFGTMMLLAPGAMMASFNVEASNVAEEIMRGMSLMALAMAYISWQMPNWVGDHIKSVGMFFSFTCCMGCFIIVSNEFRCISIGSC